MPGKPTIDTVSTALVGLSPADALDVLKLVYAVADEQAILMRDSSERQFQLSKSTIATTEQLEHIATLIPTEWLPAAVGSPEICATRVRDQFDAGADGVILHGASPSQVAEVVRAYRPRRQAKRFAGRAANPGR